MRCDEDELRCRDVGMDAYLRKPVPLPRLQAAIEEWLPATPNLADPAVIDQAATAAPAAIVPAVSPVDAPAGHLAALPVVDLAVLKALIGNDEDVIADVLCAFKDSADECSAELSQAVLRSDLNALAEAAHKFKSAAFSIGAGRLGDSMCPARKCGTSRSACV